MLFSLSAKSLFLILSLGQINIDATSDAASDMIAANQPTIESELEAEVIQPAQAAIAEQKTAEQKIAENTAMEVVIKKELPANSKVGKTTHRPLSAPGALAYKRGAAAGLALGATIVGSLLSFPLLVSEIETGSNGGDLSVMVAGSILLASSLGFGPSLGQLCALGKGANLAIPVIRTVAVLAPALFTSYFMAVGSQRNTLNFGDYYQAFRIATIASASIAAVWGIVDIAMTPAFLRRYVRRYEKQQRISNLITSPIALENGGGMMVAFKF